jgi:hypothetical protein
MISFEHIPPQSRGAAEAEFKASFDLSRAIAAAINAWPGMVAEKDLPDPDFNSHIIILPLPPEKVNR